MNDEKNISAKQPTTEEEARLSRADENPQWAQGAQRSSTQGQGSPGRLRDARFPGTARIRTRGEYQKIYGRGVRAGGRWLMLFAVAAEGDGRLGVTASRKVGGSVVRSRCKRRIRELYRLYYEAGKTPVDVVVNARRGCHLAPWDDLVVEFRECLKKVRTQVERRSGPSEATRDGFRRSSRRRAAINPPVRSTRRRRSDGTD